jgi:hypothetical protein
MLPIAFVNDAADLDLQADDFNVGVCEGRAKTFRRERASSGNERDSCGLSALTDRDFSDAFQAAAQRHFQCGCAGGSSDASDLSEDALHALSRPILRRSWNAAREAQDQQSHPDSRG